MSKNVTEKTGAVMYELMPDQPVDISEKAFADLEDSLARVDAMKKEASISIIKAKERGLSAHVERFRVMLRKLVVMDNELKAEKELKITARLASQLDQLESDMSRELYEFAPLVEEADPTSDYTAKAKRHHLAAKLFGIVCTFACLLGCIIYFILVCTTTLVPFAWGWVIANAVMFLIFAVIGLCFMRSAATYEKLAEEDIRQQNREREAKRERLAAEESNIAEVAFELERQSAELLREKEAQKSSSLMDKLTALAGEKGADLQMEFNPKVLVPVVATGVAVICLAAILKGKKKKKAAPKKKAPKLQGIIFDWE